MTEKIITVEKLLLGKRIGYLSDKKNASNSRETGKNPRYSKKRYRRKIA